MLKNLRKRLAVIFTVFTGAVLTAVLAVSFYQAYSQTVASNELWFSSTVDRVTSTLMTNRINEEQTSFVAGDLYIISVRVNGEPMQGLVADAETGTAATAVSEEDEQAMFEQARAIAEENDAANWMMNSYMLYGFPSTAAADLVEDEQYEGEVQAAEDGGAYAQGEMLIGSDAIAIAISPTLSTEGVFEMEYAGVHYRATYFQWVMEEVGIPADEVYEVAVLENLDWQTQQLWMDGLWYVLLWAGGVVVLFVANYFLAKLVLRSTEEGLRRQTEFVAAASHELRSPLAVIRSSLSAADDAADKAQAKKFRAAAGDEAERMGHLVDDLLLLAGGDAGSWQLHKDTVDLDTLLIDAAESYTMLAKEKDVQLTLDLPGETLPKVQGDAERLRQILAVLLDNALQYAPANTAITLSAKAKRGKVHITVADRGRGVPDDEKDRVFERFYRADKSRHDKEHFGLGLSVAKELAELHKGQLTVEDTKDGGATFRLTLPAV